MSTRLSPHDSATASATSSTGTSAVNRKQVQPAGISDSNITSSAPVQRGAGGGALPAVSATSLVGPASRSSLKNVEHVAAPARVNSSRQPVIGVPQQRRNVNGQPAAPFVAVRSSLSDNSSYASSNASKVTASPSDLHRARPPQRSALRQSSPVTSPEPNYVASKQSGIYPMPVLAGTGPNISGRASNTSQTRAKRAASRSLTPPPGRGPRGG